MKTIIKFQDGTGYERVWSGEDWLTALRVTLEQAETQHHLVDQIAYVQIYSLDHVEVLTTLKLK